MESASHQQARERRREWEKAAGKVDRSVLFQVWCEQDAKCYHCQILLSEESARLDHKVPLCRGGKTERNNLCWSCEDCNLKKGGYLTAEQFTVRLKLWQDAPGDTAPCFHPKHEKYVGCIYVPFAGFNKGDVWCRECRHCYWRAYWKKHGAEIKERRKGKQCTSGDVVDIGQKGYNKS